MQFLEALRLRSPVKAAFVGSGGKTTAMFQLARLLPPPVLVTTTTHLGVTETGLADQHVIIRSPVQLDAIQPEGVLLLTRGEAEKDRLGGLDEPTLDCLCALASARGMNLLVEADGSCGLPVKAPAVHEPPVPGWVELVVVTVGLSALGKPLDASWVHRPQRFSELSELSMEAAITPDALVRVLNHLQGGLKNIPPGAKRVVLLNQADSANLQAQAQHMATALLDHYERVIISSLGLTPVQTWMDAISPYIGPVYASYSQIAGIILAGGDSKRLGKPKQLLDWLGKPMVRQVAETALQAGLSPVVVVTGAVEAEIISALQGLPVIAAHNPDWSRGQSTSIQKGLRALPNTVGAAIFMLADQPQIPTSLLASLLEAYYQSPDYLVAPLVDGQRANPALFDRLTFPDLMALKGDVGGRAIFSKFQATWVPWHDSRLLLDVDTPDDYQVLLDAYST